MWVVFAEDVTSLCERLVVELVRGGRVDSAQADGKIICGR
jgi:hypothetical protein